MALNLGTILASSARERPGHPLIRLNEQSWSYAEVDRAARGIASSLIERGLGPGDKVALLVPNVPEFTQAYFGILYAGCTVVPLNVLLSAPEVTYHVQDSEAKLLIAHPLFSNPATKGAEGAGVPLVWAGGEVPGAPSLVELAEAAPLEAIHPTRPDDTAVILYTSGTTGKPKGAELTHSNLLLNCAAVVPRLLPIQSDDVAIATLPLFHSFGQTCIQNAMISEGAGFTLLPRFTPEDALTILQRDKVTIFAGVPTMYFALLNHPGADAFDLSSLRICMTGGAPMPVEVMRAFEEKYGVQILEGYGLSETSPVASFNQLDKPRKPGSIGYPVWGVELTILDDKDQPLPEGERGEICIRGHNIMKGYLKRPEATKDALRGGWFHSGDIGVRDEDGCYWIVDRKKDMIIRGGFNVYPREVEEILYAHPAIVEAAVFGVPHPSHGEEIKAVVVLAPGQSLSADELTAYTKERLAAYKYPRIIEFSDGLPKGPTGKILKRELK
ncbi:MAG: long-chain fatty acid--CoA ligase [Deltaproteobacteria bacterium]|nr:long-chain fatty acid--CoA ligase [Deltaproteobacteria bacterium]MCZ6715143.1 long-chain fatty acid--CoA ligase [Deltaproteobacteria bacterium]MCZ6823808.1 long-chain fatty acid--CoA ligase [Deltaproteobacteria bacterium]TDJ05222.1 MAG: long-chain fatty acid--CoA ligase [Deltaproteobacteria bacterium]